MNKTKGIQSKGTPAIKNAPPSTAARTKKVGPADLVEVGDTQLLLSIDLKRQPEAFYGDLEINTDQRYFPYTVVPRLFAGWEVVSHISSMDLKFIPGTPLPQITVRFLEKMSPADADSLDAATKAQVRASMALVQQYPFIKVESPL